MKFNANNKESSKSVSLSVAIFSLLAPFDLYLLLRVIRPLLLP